MFPFRPAIAALLAFLTTLAAPPPALAQAPAIPRVGLPPADRDWTADDYTAAALTFLLMQAALPTRDDPDTGARFLKFASHATLATVDRPGDPIAQRMAAASKVLESVQTALRTYARAAARGGHGSEVVLLSALLVDVAAFAKPVIDEYLATAPRDDKFRARQEGLEQTRHGFNLLVTNAAVAIGQVEPAADKAALAEALARSLPVLRPSLSADTLTALKAQFAALDLSTAPAARDAVERAVKAIGSP